MKNLKEFVAAIIENGGATYNLATNKTVSDGYMVSKKGFEMKFDKGIDITKSVCVFIREFGIELYDEDNFIGAWIDDGILYLDISNNFKRRSDAIKQGYMNEQIAIFDVIANDSIFLPAPQKVGTMTQQQSFINYQIYNL